jgi:hypothetical protein
MEYEQRVIIKFLFNDGLDPRQIVEKLEAQFHKNGYSLRAVQFWSGEVRRGREDLRDVPRGGRASEEHITAKIQELLNQNPFDSGHPRPETLHISHSTVLKHLHDEVHFQSFYLRWVPHRLMPELREQRCRLAREMILGLTAAARDGWHHFVTGDESWFFLFYSLGRMWILTRDHVATRPRPDIHTKTSMFPVVLNPLGFPVVDKLRTGAKM